MSEKILKALMQLFAIIARPQSNDSDRRVVVEAFLRRQLNEELVKEYLTIFDDFYTEAQERQKKSAQKKRHSAVSVRVLRITTQINDQLTQDQKIIVLVQFLNSVNQTDRKLVRMNSSLFWLWQIPLMLNMRSMTLIRRIRTKSIFEIFPIQTIFW